MANLFQKPIAANPMSQFVALPLDYIDKSIQRKQAAYDESKATVEQAEDLLLNTRALPKDQIRQQAILGEYNDTINQMVDAAGGDYSRISGQLDALKRDMGRQLSANGELGAINNNYQAAMKSKTELDTLYSNKKVSDAGIEFATNRINQHQTVRGDNGQWGSFQKYTPSNIVDPVSELQKSVKEIHAKYDEEGNEFVSNDIVMGNLANKLTSNPSIKKSLVENFKMSYPNGTEEEYDIYEAKVIERVVNDRTYQKTSSRLLDAKSNMMLPGTTLDNWQQPNRIKGKSSRVGGNAAALRAAGSWAGFDTTEAHDAFVMSEEGQRMVKYMQDKTGTTMPTDYGDQIEWFEEMSAIPIKGGVVVGAVDPKVLSSVMTKDGYLNYGGATYRQDGSLESGDDQQDWQGKSEDGQTARIIGQVQSGGMYPVGSYVIMGNDGQVRIQEPRDPKTLGSHAFNLEQVESVALTNTGRLNINLQGSVMDSTDKTKVAIPAGSYEAVHDYKRGVIKLLQDGQLKYTKLPDGRIIKAN